MGYRNEYEDFFKALFLTALDITEDEDNPFIRFTYAPEGQPDWGFNDNVCFLFVAPVDSDTERQRNPYFDGENHKQYYVRELAVQLVFYGSECWDRAQKLRDRLFDDDMTQLMYKNGYGLITDVGAPQFLPELFNDRYWQRTDLALNFYKKVEELRNEQMFDDIKLVMNYDK